SGRLRTGIRAVVDGHRISATADWTRADGFFTGWQAEIFSPDSPAKPAWSGTVRHSTGSTLEVSPALPEALSNAGITTTTADSDQTTTAAPATGEAGWTLEIHTGEPAPVTGARLLTGTRLDAVFPPHEYRLATTLATNALLENQGAEVAFLV